MRLSQYTLIKNPILLIILAFSIYSCGESNITGNGDLSTGNSNEVTLRNDDPNSTGLPGSLAQFTIVDNYFYSVLDNELKTFEIGNDLHLNFKHQKELNFVVETIFPFEDYLLMGAETGMFIYEIREDGKPIHISEFEHVRSCDPVVAQGDYAFVTLRTGGDCRGVNRFDILNIEDKSDPHLVSSTSLTEPYGLAVAGDVVFVCQGIEGVSVYDVRDKSAPKLITTLTDFAAKDVILDVHKNIAMFMGYGKLIQLDYSNIQSIKEISRYDI